MKLNGQQLRNTSSSLFQLPRGGDESLSLRLQPLSLGFHQRLRARGIYPPIPPAKIARDSTGKPLRDPQGQALTLSDRQDVNYLMAVDRYHQCVAVLSVAESLRDDTRISFDAVPPATDEAADWQFYTDRLHAELEQAGFAAGDLILLCREICRLSNLIEDHLAGARQNFSSSAPASSG